MDGLHHLNALLFRCFCDLYHQFMQPFIFFWLSNSKVQGDWSLSQLAQDERQYASRTGCQSITGLCCMRFLIQMILTIAGTFRGRYVSLHSVYLQMPEKLLTKLSILSVSSSYILQSTCEWTWSSCTYSHAVSLIDVSVLTISHCFVRECCRSSLVGIQSTSFKCGSWVWFVSCFPQQETVPCINHQHVNTILFLIEGNFFGNQCNSGYICSSVYVCVWFDNIRLPRVNLWCCVCLQSSD